MPMRLSLLVLLAAGALAAGGCVSEPPAVVIPGGRSTGAFVLKHTLQDTIDMQRAADLQFQSTLAQAGKIASLGPDVFGGSYPGLVPDLQRCEMQAALARQLLERMDMESGSAPAEIQPQLAQASAAMHASQAMIDSLLEHCRTQMLYLKKNPQHAGTSDVRKWSRNLRSEIKRLHTQVSRSSAQAQEVALAL